MFDFIGDIHGHADQLEALLMKMGYTYKNGSYSHPTRKVFFVGDYIDRGPKIRETLRIVRDMVESDNAIALMGNHEYNAICFSMKKSEGGHLRPHEIKNILQHNETLRQFKGMQEQYDDYINWFKTFPLFYETEQFRAVHACWDHKNISYLKNLLPYEKLNDELIVQSVQKEYPLHNAIEETLKGKEIQMPDGLFFNDKDGNSREEIRIKWWHDPLKSTYRSLSVEPLSQLPEVSVAAESLKSGDFYTEEHKPVFFGHYWLKGNPSLLRNNICCLDYSVAKNGHLVAYRFDGEERLSENKLIFV